MVYLGKRYTPDGRKTPEYQSYLHLEKRISRLEQLLADEIRKAEIRELKKKLEKLEKESGEK